MNDNELIYPCEIGFPHITMQYRKHESFQPSENKVYPYASVATS